MKAGIEPAHPIAAVVTALRAAGVERFVFCSYAHKPGIARDLNEWLAHTSREMGGYGLPEFIRISIGTPAENARCIDSLRRVTGKA